MTTTYLANTELLSFNLSKSAYKVASFLYASANYRTGESYKSHNTIAKGTGYSVSTIKRALKELLSTGIVTVVNRFVGNGRQTSNLYKVAAKYGTKAKFQGDSTTLNTLNGTQLKVYNYIRYSMGKKGNVFISKKKLAGILRLSIDTIHRVIKKLLSLKLITALIQHRPDGGNCWNVYSLFSAPNGSGIHELQEDCKNEPLTISITKAYDKLGRENIGRFINITTIGEAFNKSINTILCRMKKLIE